LSSDSEEDNFERWKAERKEGSNIEEKLRA
jgi:hypothetical protein